MFIFNVANPITLILLLAITLILIFIGKETKKGYFTAIALFVFLAFLMWHIGQIVTIAPEYESLKPTLTSCLVVDFVMILLSFLSYLWVDEIESRKGKKKSFDAGLDWFWGKV